MRSCVWLICLVGCGRVDFDPRSVDAAGDLDGPAPQLLGGPLVSVDPTTLPPFSAPQLVLALSSDGFDDDDPCLTRDMLEIFFDSKRGGSNQLYTSTRTSLMAPWSPPVLVAGLSSGSAEEHPQISGSGLTLYFTSSRGGEPNLWVTTRPTRDGAWTTPIEVDHVNSAETEETGGMDALETVMVFSSNRGGMTTNDLYESSRPSGSGPWSDPIAISELNTPSYDRSVHLDDRGLVMYLELGAGTIDWTRRLQLGGAWSSPVELVELASPDNDTDPWVSPDLRTLYFVRDSGPGTKDIYMAKR